MSSGANSKARFLRSTARASSADRGPRLVVAGVVRNAERTLSRDIKRLARGLRGQFRVEWVIVESDSSDRTVNRLKKLSSRYRDFHFESLGDLEPKIPDRVERISHCRNRYLEIIEARNSLSGSDWVLVVDLDNLNRRVAGREILKLTQNTEASAYFANQLGPYYDIFALRHPVWNPEDFSLQTETLENLGISPKLARAIAVEAKMVRIEKTGPLIFVDSAFGGMALYSFGALKAQRYSTDVAGSRRVCEHVGLNLSLRSMGHKLAISPSLVNARYTEHTANFHPVFRITKWISARLRQPLIKILGQDAAVKLYFSVKRMFPWS